MLYKKDDRILSFFINSQGYLVPRPCNENIKISKTIYPYLLGKKKSNHFYDLEKSLYAIRASLEVIKIIISYQGSMSFINISPLLQLRASKDTNVSFVNSRRGSLLSSTNSDLFLLNRVSHENLIEAHKKCLLLIGVGSPTISNISYPFNLNITNPLLADWFFGAIYTTYARGKKTKTKNVKIPPLLGRGPKKSISANLKYK